MTTEELLIPRYICTADYPQPPYNEGDEHKFIEGDLLIQCNVNGVTTFRRYGRLGHMSVGVPCCTHPEKYRKIFRLLQWWEERKPEDVVGIYVEDGDGFYFKVVSNEECQKPFENNIIPLKFIHPINYHYTPITETEYNAYINQKQPPNKP